MPKYLLADFLPPFLGDLLQHFRIMPAAPAALKPVDATHLFTQTASAAMLSNEGLVLEDVPAFTQYTAFTVDGEEGVSRLERAQLQVCRKAPHSMTSYLEQCPD